MKKQSVEKEGLTFYERTRLITYLDVAQSDAATLSLNLKGTYQGSLDPISRKVMGLFLKKVSLPEVQSDEYSNLLAKIVFEKVKQRVEKENSQTNEFVVPEKDKKDFSAGLIVAKWIPWYAAPSKNFWPPPPPKPDDPIWKEEVKKIKAAQEPMTDEKKKIINKWAGIPDQWSEDWRSFANEYMVAHNVPFGKMLQIRSALMVGLYDTVAAYATMKYHYQTIRPKVYDTSVTYIIEVPKHPSYPAGHSSEGSMGATILSYYFPSESTHWQQLAQEEGLSRIQAGIHYPIDIEAGHTTGKKVAEKVLQAVNQNREPDKIKH